MDHFKHFEVLSEWVLQVNTHKRKYIMSNMKLDVSSCSWFSFGAQNQVLYPGDRIFSRGSSVQNATIVFDDPFYWRNWGFFWACETILSPFFFHPVCSLDCIKLTRLEFLLQLVATITHQSHLCPLPLFVQPIIWNYDQALYLYPNPHTVMLVTINFSVQF